MTIAMPGLVAMPMPPSRPGPNGKAAAAGSPLPSFTALPSISPPVGQVGTTFSVVPGIITNGVFAGRRWLLTSGGTTVEIGTGPTVTPVAGGSLVLEVTASRSDGSGRVSVLSAPVTVAVPVYVDADLNQATSFKQLVLSYDQGGGDRAAQLYAAFPFLKAALGVGHKTTSLAAIAGDPRWNSGTGTLTFTTASPTLTGVDVPGQTIIGSGVAADVVISDSRITALAGGGDTTYKVQKSNSDTTYKVTLQDVTLEYGQGINPGRFNLTRVFQRYSAADNLKGGSAGGAVNPQRIQQSWLEACGYGNPLAHGDGIQWSSTGDTVVVSSVFYSAPNDSVYSTNSYGLTNALRIDASNGSKLVQRVRFLGNLVAFGSYYPLTIAAQQTDSIVRNITVAFNVFAPAAFRLGGNAGDAVQMHPGFTDDIDGGGLKENVGFFGNIVFGYGPVEYKDRTDTSKDITGIWHYNPATLDADTVALWKELGLLKSDGTPAAGMLRSVAGVITQQPKTVATTGRVPLNLDLSGVPSDAMITLHLPAGTNMNSLEYIA